MAYLKNSNLKYVLAWILIGCMLYVDMGSIRVQAVGKVITIEQAVQYAQMKSTKYKKKQKSREPKVIKLQQAIQGIRDVRIKETTIRFALPFTIKWPEKHALPKEIDLVMKIPRIETDIANIDRELNDILLAEREKAENTFIDVYAYQEKSKIGRQILKEMETSLKKMALLQKAGQAKEKDVETLSKKVLAQRTKVASLVRAFDKSKEKLSNIVKFDVTNGYTFKNPLKKINVPIDYTDQLVQYTLNTDFNMFRTRNAENIARRTVSELYHIYGVKWGGLARRLEQEATQETPINKDALDDKYEQLLYDVDNPWRGDWKLRIYFITISIPKEWFKGEFDGTRYFDDEKYAIIAALGDKEDAIAETESVKKDLVNSVIDGHEGLQELWKAYTTSIDTLSKSKNAYTLAKMRNQQGKASFDELETEKTNFQSAQETEFDNLVNYNKQSVAYDRVTCGAINKFRENMNLFLQSVKTGQSVIDDVNRQLEAQIGANDNANPDRITYSMTNLVDQYKVAFKVHVPEAYPDKIAQYEVMTSDGIVVISKTDIKKTATAVPVVYKGSTKMIVRFYNDDKFVVEGSFDAITPSGPIELTKTNTVPTNESVNTEVVSEPQVRIVGKYTTTEMKELEVTKLRFDIPAEEGIAYYKIVNSDGIQLGKKTLYSISDSFTHLGFTIKDLSQLKVQLYDNDKNLKETVEFDQSTKELVVK